MELENQMERKKIGEKGNEKVRILALFSQIQKKVIIFT